MQFSERRFRIMTIDEVAKYLRLHKSTVYRMVRESQIPASKIGNQWRFRKDVIDSWLSTKESPEITKTSPKED